MPLNSVNTNVGARDAVRYFGATATELATTQGRVSTGLRVASARDNGAVWSIAQSQRGDARAIGVIIGGLQRAQSVLDVGLTAGEGVSDLLVRMKTKALAAADTGLSADSRAALSRDFEQLRDQVTRLVNNAGFDGVNLIKADAVGYKARAGLATVTQKVIVGYFPPDHPKKAGQPKFGDVTGPSTLDVAAERLNLGGPNVTVLATDALTDAGASAVIVGKLETSIRNTGLALAGMGANFRQVERQADFLSKLRDGLITGVGTLVDADLGRESARLQALQVRQQLGSQALGIANRAPTALLGLFR
ncbi:MAG: flagellin [Proteobacteria bacterium]|nr:flagellin [Pseudomonadota bacterium]